MKAVARLKYDSEGTNTDLPAKDLLALLATHSKFSLVMSAQEDSSLYAAKGKLTLVVTDKPKFFSMVRKGVGCA